MGPTKPAAGRHCGKSGHRAAGPPQGGCFPGGIFHSMPIQARAPVAPAKMGCHKGASRQGTRRKGASRVETEPAEP